MRLILTGEMPVRTTGPGAMPLFTPAEVAALPFVFIPTGQGFVDHESSLISLYRPFEVHPDGHSMIHTIDGVVRGEYLFV